MSTDNDWWAWIHIGAFFLLTTPATYVPVARALGIFWMPAGAPDRGAWVLARKFNVEPQ